jgi:cytochrome P450
MARYAPALLKQLLRGAWQQLQRYRHRNTTPRHLFVFGGRTHYWPGIGRELYVREPAFRATVQECERIITALGGPSLLANFEGPIDNAFFADESRMQVIITTIQIAIVELWRSYGVQPDAVLGISSGEAAAVYAAGGLSLESALRMSLSSALISQVEPANYTILTVSVGFERASELAAACPTELFINTVVDTNLCLLLCAVPDAAAVKAYLQNQGVICHQLKAGPMWPYHTARLRRRAEQLRKPIQEVTFRPLTRPCYLATLGRVSTLGTIFGADYLLLPSRFPVQLHDTLQAALRDGYQLFIPMGSDPLPYYNRPTKQKMFGDARILQPLEPTVSEWTAFTTMRQELKAWGLVNSQALARPALSLSAFLAQFTQRTPDFLANPYPSYAFLRQHGSVHFLPHEQGWMVLDGDLINAILRDPLVYSSTANNDFDQGLIGADPPIHTHNRGVFQPFFSAKKLSGLADFTTAITAELGAEMARRPSFDFVTEFSVPLTQAVGAELLGLSKAELRHLQASLPGHTYALMYFRELKQFFTTYFQQRQTPEQPVMLDHLLEHIHAGELTEAAALGLAQTMWLAGITTSSMLISSAAYYLLTHPAVAGQLRAEPELLDAFIEEMLRLEPPLNTFWRVTTQPVTLGGQNLPAGSKIICCIAAANRDPVRYPNPDELDLHRASSRHLSFGNGIHACMGAHLARLETRIALRWLLAQGPSFQLANQHALPNYFPTNLFRALATLPVTLQSPPHAT